ncbi:hypothetical protein BKN38_00300 [Helicobacter sp. CLO-3]|nr:hypothetical protein BKN38_00300 [Helicobacter sp. CLO-3]
MRRFGARFGAGLAQNEMQAKKRKLKPALKFAGELCPPPLRNRLIVIFDFEVRGTGRKILKKVEG